MNILIYTMKDKILWQDLVGKEHEELGYKIIINSYNNKKNVLSISEFHNNYPYTNEIVTIEKDKCLNILKNYGFNITFKEIFNYSEETIIKLKGLQQAGFSYIIYNNSTKKFMVDNIFELTFLTSEEREHLLVVKFYDVLKIEINDIINNKI